VLEYRGAVTKEYKVALKVHFEDEDLAVVEKPPGLATSGNQWKTLQNALPSNIQHSGRKDALSVPLTVHRLDAKTHGLVLVAKTASARIQLGRLFEARKVQKTYTAILQGKLTGEGAFNAPIEGKEALTFYKVLSHFQHVKDDWNSLVELSPVTGRKHQLRIHCAQSGHPIVGDVKYSDQENVR
jgi:23S rRNA-/tRNA-specific pseudouridylate synthase